MRRVRFEVIMADMLKSMMDKITDDNPETRGQKLWVMFALAVLLVAAMNYYAMVREPEIIPMDELVEFNTDLKGELTIVISEKKIDKKNSQILSESDKRNIKKMINKLSIKEISNLIHQNNKISKKIIYDYCLKIKNEN